MEKKSKFVNIFLILLVIIIVVMVYFIYKTYNNKMTETNQINKSNTTSENTIENLTLENITETNIITPSDKTNTSTEIIKYEFTSADSLAAQGNPGILKIFELSNTQMRFEYNHGWNFEESTIDRKITGIAEKNIENIYEFTEYTQEHKYTIKIKFTQEMVTLSEYIDDDLISRINLWS